MPFKSVKNMAVLLAGSARAENLQFRLVYLFSGSLAETKLYDNFFLKNPLFQRGIWHILGTL